MGGYCPNRVSPHPASRILLCHVYDGMTPIRTCALPLTAACRAIMAPLHKAFPFHDFRCKDMPLEEETLSCGYSNMTFDADELVEVFLVRPLLAEAEAEAEDAGMGCRRADEATEETVSAADDETLVDVRDVALAVQVAVM